jgi:hypothetical protein
VLFTAGIFTGTKSLAARLAFIGMTAERNNKIKGIYRICIFFCI